jgi:hypothetical protein
MCIHRTLGIEHSRTTQGRGGTVEFIGGYGLRKGVPTVPQWSWDFDSQPGICTLALKLPGITDKKSVTVEIGELGMMVNTCQIWLLNLDSICVQVFVYTGDEDDPPPEGPPVYEVGWRMPIERCLVSSERGKIKFINEAPCPEDHNSGPHPFLMAGAELDVYYVYCWQTRLYRVCYERAGQYGTSPAVRPRGRFPEHQILDSRGRILWIATTIGITDRGRQQSPAGLIA